MGKTGAVGHATEKSCTAVENFKIECRPACPAPRSPLPSDWTGSGLLKPFNSLLVPFVVASFSSVSTFPFQTTLSSSWRTKFTMVPLASILVCLNLFYKPRRAQYHVVATVFATCLRPSFCFCAFLGITKGNGAFGQDSPICEHLADLNPPTQALPTLALPSTRVPMSRSSPTSRVASPLPLSSPSLLRSV